MTKHGPVPKPYEPPEGDRHGLEAIDPLHRASVEAGLADWRAGRIASEAEIDAAFAKFGRPRIITGLIQTRSI